ncbi:MAG: hypothetical protein J6N92_05800 [Alloprevotella sp.]|nr:hypothetical protein [Alloprevotella sp.]
MVRHSLIVLLLFLSSCAAVAQGATALADENRTLPPYHNTFNPADPVRQAKPGILVCGVGDSIRSFSVFKMPTSAGLPYAEICNKYQRLLPEGVQVYCMPIPTQGEFYTPDAAGGLTHSQAPAIEAIFAALSDSVMAVDVYSVLAHHAAEPIYLRTDHHWAPLGAYYAAQRFAALAGVPFNDLIHYDIRSVHGFCGTMARYSGDARLKQHPEDFVYYVPRAAAYETTFVDYTLDRQRQHAVRASEPHAGSFFKAYADGSSAAYCTFMGGDPYFVHVSTKVGNNRRLLILKDSFGNALSAFLFFSFEDIYVADCRYFMKNVVQLVRERGITDVLFANNMDHALMPKTIASYERYLVQ